MSLDSERQYTLTQRYSMEIHEDEVISTKDPNGFWFPWHLHEIVRDKFIAIMGHKDRRIAELEKKLFEIKEFMIETFDIEEDRE